MAPGAGIYDPVHRRAATPNGTFVAGAKGGVGLKATSNSALGANFGASVMSSSNGSGTGDFSYLVIANPVASTTREFFVVCGDGTNEAYLGANFSTDTGDYYHISSGSVTLFTDAGGPNNGITAAGAADGNVHSYLGTRIGTTYSIYVDGILANSASTSASQMWSGSSNDMVGGWSGTGWGISNSVLLVVGWNRGVTADEARSLFMDPTQLFVQPARRIFTAGAAPIYQRALCLLP